MDVLFALIGLFLLTEFFYFVRHPIGKPLPLSKTTKLIAGSVGLVGAMKTRRSYIWALSEEQLASLTQTDRPKLLNMS
jgi:hypothetical protein